MPAQYPNPNRAAGKKFRSAPRLILSSQRGRAGLHSQNLAVTHSPAKSFREAGQKYYMDGVGDPSILEAGGQGLKFH